MQLTPSKILELESSLQETILEHSDLKHIIEIMHEKKVFDELQVRRLKKRKLLLKDKIIYLENALIPNLDA